MTTAETAKSLAAKLREALGLEQRSRAEIPMGYASDAWLTHAIEITAEVISALESSSQDTAPRPDKEGA